MNIAVFVSVSSHGSDFIVETFFPLFEQFSGHKVTLITDVSIGSEPASNLAIINIKPQPKSPLLKKIWFNRTLRQALKKTGCEIFISSDTCFSSTDLVQCLLIVDPGNVKMSYAKKADLLIVLNESARLELVNRNIKEDKIAVVYPAAGKLYFVIDEKRKEAVKDKYSAGKEYFLYSSNFRKTNELIDLLKSFSYFKKRQQSSFKLVLLTSPHLSFEKAIENYKYRDDVIIIRPEAAEDKTTIMAASFALVLPFNENKDIRAALNAMQSAVPVIITKYSTVNEIAEDAVLCAENEVKDIGEKMMQLYKDEALRSLLIEKGKERAKNFTEEKSAARLLQSIMRVSI